MQSQSQTQGDSPTADPSPPSAAPSAGGEELLVSKLPDTLFVANGERRSDLAEIEAGSRPAGEFFVLRSIASNTLSMRDVHPDKLGSHAFQAAFAWEAARFAKKHRNLKLCVIGEEFPGIYVLAALRLLRPDVKKVMLVHNVSSLKRQLGLRYLRLIHQLDRVLCLSESSRVFLIDKYGVDPRKISVLGSRVDTDFFSTEALETSGRPSFEGVYRPGEREEGLPLVASAGMINRDYETLVRAASGLDVHLKIAADSAWRYSVGKNAQPPPEIKNPRVEMRSFHNYVNLRNLYASADVVVVPLHEGDYASGQTVILEAMAMGKPVVTSDIRGRSDFIDHGINGIYVKPNDPAAMKAAISELLNDRDRARAIGVAAAQHVREKFTVTNYVNRWLSACVSALAD